MTVLSPLCSVPKPGMSTQQCCIPAALCYTLCCTKKPWLTCACPVLVHHCSLQSSTSGYADFVRQTSQIMILVCAWFLLCLQKEPYCDSPGWISEYSELSYISDSRQWHESECPGFFVAFRWTGTQTALQISAFWAIAWSITFVGIWFSFFLISLNFYEKKIVLPCAATQS